MGAWAIWIFLAIVFAFFELLTPSFFFLWFAIGALITAILTLFINSTSITILLFVLMSFILWLSTRKIAKKLYFKSSPSKLFQDSLKGKKGKILSIDEQRRLIIKVEGEEWRAWPQDENQSFEIGEFVMVNDRKGNILFISKEEEKGGGE